MPVLRVSGFDGVVPRSSATMLSQNQAQTADNVKLYERELRYWRGPTLAYTPALADVRTIYRLYGPDDASVWLTWNTDVSVAPGPLADVTEFRIYYTGEGTPRKTNYTLATTGAAPYPVDGLEMGVPAPSTPPAVTRTGTPVAPKFTLDIRSDVRLNDSGTLEGSLHISGTTTAAASTVAVGGTSPNYTLTVADAVGTSEDAALNDPANPPFTDTLTTSAFVAGSDYIQATTDEATLESRAYVYTYVSTFGNVQEESAPSPASQLIEMAYGESVVIDSFSPAPGGDYNITSMRIYRTVTGATTDSYLFVAEVPIATTTYTDSLSYAQLGENLTTIGWVPPPDDLEGLVALSNGSLAGFVGNTVYFSEPYFPHAWPLAYAISLPHNVVGLGVFGSSVVACTDRFPYILSGVAPGAMSSEQVPITEPCVARSTIASDQHGVLYASPNGLVSIGPGGSSMTTTNLYRRDEWQGINAEYMHGAIYDEKYFGVYGAPYSENKSPVLSRDDIPSLSHITLNARCAFVDNKSSNLFVVDDDDNLIYQIDADELNPYTYVWTSKRFVLPQSVTWSAVKLDSDYGAIADDVAYQALVDAANLANTVIFASDTKGALNSFALNAEYEVNGSLLENLPPTAADRVAELLIYGDGFLQATMSLSSFNPVRIPAFRARELMFTLRGNIPVRSITFATTVQELATADA